MILTTRAALAQCMRKLVQERIDALKDVLAYGAAVTSYETYREHVGMIHGLQEALELMDEADKKLNEHER